MRSIDRGVVLLSKNMSFPTANDRLGVNLGTIFASNKHKKCEHYETNTSIYDRSSWDAVVM